MTMSTSAKEVVEKSEYWIRVNLALEFCVKEALIHVLHNLDNDPSYKGLPTDPKDLYQYMLKCKGKPIYKRILKADQWALLCPSNGQTDSKEWDITLLIFVIRNETPLKPQEGWKDKPSPNDNTKGGCLDRARHLRNDLNHGSVEAICTEPQFDGYWDRIEKILVGLNYQNLCRFKDLKTESLDKHNSKILILVTSFKKEVSDNTSEIKNLNAKIYTLEEALKNEADGMRKDLRRNNKKIAANEENISNIKEELRNKRVEGIILISNHLKAYC